MGTCYVTQGAQPSALWRHPERCDGVGDGRNFQEGGDIRILMTDLGCCMAETNTG